MKNVIILLYIGVLEKKILKKDMQCYRVRRGVAERTHSWVNRFKRLLIIWKNKIDNHSIMFHLAYVWITFGAAGLLDRLLTNLDENFIVHSKLEKK